MTDTTTKPGSPRAGESNTDTLTLGIVPYLNVHPLIFTLRGREDIRLEPEPPSRLADRLRADAYDAAIVPIFEYLNHAARYTLVPGVSIASYGPVRSVALFAGQPLETIRRVHLDPASLTSVHLLKVLLAEEGREVEFVSAEWKPGQRLAPEDGALLIGDAALAEQGNHAFAFDLADWWRTRTGLPFVFAAWVAGERGSTKPLNEMLLSAKEAGVAQLPAVATQSAREMGMEKAAIYDYFARAICYDLGQPELDGILEFARLCHKHGLLPEMPALRFHPL